MFRQNKKMVVGVVIVLLMTVSMLFADVPNQCNFQGRLLDSNGNPVNGTKSITFAIFGNLNGGIPSWAETHSVEVNNGLFKVNLGSINSLENITPGLSMFLALEVEDDDEMSPRTKINSVPYAMTDGDWTKDGDNIYSALSGNVGVGVATPTAKLEVNGGSGTAGKFESNGDVPTFHIVHTNEEGAGLALEIETASSLGLNIQNTGNGPAAEFSNNSGTESTVKVENTGDGPSLEVVGLAILNTLSGGNTNFETLAIGVANPTAKLHVVDSGNGPAAKFSNNSSTEPTVTIQQDNASGEALVVQGVSKFMNKVGIGVGNPAADLHVSANNSYPYMGLLVDNFGNGSAAKFSGHSYSDATVKIYQNNSAEALWVENEGGGTAITALGDTDNDVVRIENGGSGNALLVGGDVDIIGSLSKSGGSFKIDHPLDPANKYLYHSFVESPDMMNVYNGNVILDNNGETIVELPRYFETLNKDFRYQLTCIGGFAQVYIAEKISDNKFKIAGGKSGLEVSWQVTGIRNDPYAQEHRMSVEKDKPADEKGKYRHPELYGQGEEKGINYKKPTEPIKEKQEG